ncbi:unnamed protein product [Paramecium octaurelia]|uniref:Uncharacterized protein n=1 Tax=Paramecium octaurelia TaxID=43137 RepID=A0A8S1W7X0_PAROT|nr:unnamed protein product [Paramecium octaurelia]CAD8183963.1 unnamed protein product [Paramecium octaurelia]
MTWVDSQIKWTICHSDIIFFEHPENLCKINSQNQISLTTYPSFDL